MGVAMTMVGGKIVFAAKDAAVRKPLRAQ